MGLDAQPSPAGPQGVTWFLSHRPDSVFPMKTCKYGHPLEGPDADVRIDANGKQWCRPCVRRRSVEYRRRKFGPVKTYPETCTIEGCDRPYEAKGLCARHYHRQYHRGGDPAIRLRHENAGRRCAVKGCERDAERLGMCHFHYKRQYVGRPLDAPYRDPNRTLKDRLFEKIEVDENGCWNWTGGKSHGNRGSVGIRTGKTTHAYRAMYEVLEGPIPEGLTLDHLCLNPLCCNPGHLEPVTRSENSRRQAETNRRLRREAS